MQYKSIFGCLGMPQAIVSYRATDFFLFPSPISWFVAGRLLMDFYDESADGSEQWMEEGLTFIFLISNV